MISRKIMTALTITLLPFSHSVLASSVINLSTSHAEGRTGSIPTITVWQGMGLSLNFSGIGEHIIKAWLDDPSRLTLDFDTPLCGNNQQNSRCGSDTSLIHLRRIHPLKFAHLPATPTTLLTVVTQAQGTRKAYYFNVGYGHGKAKYVAININPDLRPVLQQRQRLAEATTARTNRLEQGLNIARQRDISKQNKQVFERVEILITHVRGGMSFADALRRVNLAPSVLDQLEALVENRQRALIP